MPRRIGKVFLDLEANPNYLSERNEEVLRKSRFLIVVCSPRAPKSEIVNREIEIFKNLGRGGKIVTLIIEGKPADSFPSLLCEVQRTKIVNESGLKEIEEVLEPLAADIGADKLRKSLRLLKEEKLRLLATIIGCSFDELKRRHRERLLRQVSHIAAGIFLGVSLLGAFYFYQWKEAEEQQASAIEATVKADEKRQYLDEATQAVSENTRLLDDSASATIIAGNEAEKQEAASKEMTTLAETKTAKAKNEKKLADIQSDIAQKQTELALEASDNLLFELTNKFEKVPEAAPILKKIQQEYNLSLTKDNGF